jgi:anti-anti-sigma factor
MQILQDRAAGTAIIAPTGRIDSEAAVALGTAFAQLTDAREPRVVVDLTGVEYISSAGLGVLFALAKRMRAGGGALALCALGDQVRRVFDLAGFMPHFTITATRDDAIACVAAEPAR